MRGRKNLVESSLVHILNSLGIVNRRSVINFCTLFRRNHEASYQGRKGESEEYVES